jgi:uncharacterized membrane protein
MTETSAYSRDSTMQALPGHIDQNIENVAALQRREWDNLSPFQRRIERLSRLISRPLYFSGLIALIALWVGINLGVHRANRGSWDPPPFEILDGVMTFLSLMTTTIVLIAQNRQTKLEQQHAHLDLQVNILTEQKVTKLIHLIEELRRDLPMVRDRQDAQSDALQESTNTLQVLSAIEERGLVADSANEEKKPSSPT